MRLVKCDLFRQFSSILHFI